MRKKVRKERYSVTISSRTDARKKPLVIRLTQRMLVIVACAVPLVVFGFAAAAIATSLGASNSGAEAAALEAEADIQLCLLDTYSLKLSSLRQAQHEYGVYFAAVECAAVRDDSLAMAAVNTQSGETQCETALSLYLSKHGYAGSSPESIPLIPMTDAIAMINSDFQAKIDAEIESLKKKEKYTDYNIVYDGDLEGDSNAVSNWADVLSIYAAETMYDGQKFLTITPANIGLLSEIYNDMNEVTLDAGMPSGDMMGAASVDEAGEGKPTIHVSVNSLTYDEEVKKRKLSSKQKKLVNNLMSPHYYTYFADLLGIDVYDGVRSEELEEIIANLPKGTKGEAIVQAAIMRIGHPYSRGRRGSGNYVDCSYFTWWAYNQAGISLPTSSVEQAKYCYNKKYVVKVDELKPGDLIFWRKTTCNCGRWREIHHAGIYIGDGKVIDASSSKGRVVMRKLWSDWEWKIALCARPYKEDEPIVTPETEVTEQQ